MGRKEYKQLQEEGYLVIREFYKKEELQSLNDEINEIGSFIYQDKLFSLDKPFRKEYLEKQSEFYNSLRYFTSLKKFSALDKNIKLANELGLKHPCIMNACNIRMDTPENKNLFHWHQDTTYLLGSLNALTFWVPLTEVNIKNGTIELVPKTHNKGFYPFKNLKPIDELKYKRGLSPTDIYLVEEPKKNVIHVEAKPGDLIVFYQMLLHRSTPTKCEYTRWSVQLRYSDLKDEKFLDSGYPFGDVNNIYKTNYIL
jgi:ectoine hydroxylase-related dioxygenase (phytanoyl-CoA dioxygenase family)